MSKEPIPFWEKTYLDDSAITFSATPNATVTEFEHLLDKETSILEAGCGEGQNAIYLARQGFADIDAFDISENGIAKLRRIADANNVRLNAFVADLTAYPFEKTYGLVMCFGTLHFVRREQWKEFIDTTKTHTAVGGIHIMQIFTDTVPASDDIAPFAVGLAKDGEIKEMYSDWEILQFRSYVFDDEHPGVPKHRHSSNKIVARRIQ